MDRYYRNKSNGKAAKITTFKLKHLPQYQGKYYVALFEPYQVNTENGYYTDSFKSAISSAKSFIKE